MSNESIAVGSTEKLSVFTVGHSSHTLERFFDLLANYAIEVLVDVRSYPRSKYAPQFHIDSLKVAAQHHGLKYLFLGDELGGRPKDEEYYDQDGYVLYWKLAESPKFCEGLSRLMKGIKDYRIALMCSEEDPSACHRHLLIARVLAERGILVNHIRGHGAVESESQLCAAEEARSSPSNGLQLMLFGEPEERTWKSTRSVLPREPRLTSSKRLSALG